VSAIGRRGISLVGFLVALTVLSFVFIPFFLAFQQSRTGTQRSLNGLVAANVAASVMERYRAKPFKTLEALLLGLDPAKVQESTNVINGPFERNPPRPDVLERQLHRAGATSFDAEIWLSYFPEPNPDPDSRDFPEARQRIAVRVVVLWKDRMSGGTMLDQRYVLTTVVHNERYGSKPSLRRLIERGGEN
jgi:hypothetical protein